MSTMKKNIIILISSLFCGTLFSQVGINTPNPQGVFNIDGGKDNPKTGSAHTAAQQLNDVTVLQNGNVGLGTITPTAKLEIQTGGTTTVPVPGFKLIDGSQSAGAMLTSTNDQGNAKWTVLGTAKGAVIGTIETPGLIVTSDQNNGQYRYTNYKIELTTGNWIVNTGLRLNNTMNVNIGDGTWVHGLVSTDKVVRQQIGFSQDANSNAGYAAALIKNETVNSPNFFAGTTNITVTAPSVTLYLLLDNVKRYGGATSGVQWLLDSNAKGNYFYAIPVNK